MSSKKIYLDCTYTYRTGLSAGIQRVVRNIIDRQELYKKEFGAQCIPVVFFGQSFYEVDPQTVSHHRLFSESIVNGVKSRFDAFKSAVLNHTKAIKILATVLEKTLNFVRSVLKSIFKLIKTFESLKISLSLKKVRFEPDNTLVLLDSFWTHNLNNLEKFLEGRPLKVITVIYDIIPLTHPQFVDIGNLRDFVTAFERVVALSDGFLCISKTVASDLMSYLVKNLPQYKDKNIKSFYLGCDFKHVEFNPDFVREDLKSVFANSDVWLTVGTIEPRKNQDFIIDCFEDLWLEGFEEKLLIVGKIGWNCESTIERILNHPENGKRLFFKNDVNDSDLQYCYYNSRALVFASHAEGFGLPIVEAIQSGLSVVCSDIPIFREVGGDIPSFFSLANGGDLKGLLRSFSRKEKKKADFSPTGWDDSARSFISKLNQEV